MQHFEIENVSTDILISKRLNTHKCKLVQLEKTTENFDIIGDLMEQNLKNVLLDHSYSDHRTFLNR